MSVTSHGPEPCASANSAIPARIKLVDGDGFEPSKSTTTDLQSAPFGRSGTHPRKVIWNWLFGFQGNFGAGDGTRTRNLLITNQLLCQLSYFGVTNFFVGKNGAGDGTRTRNLLITNQLLCQLSYTSQQIWCLRVDLNHRHRDFQSLALPAELPRQEKWRPGGGSNP